MATPCEELRSPVLTESIVKRPGGELVDNKGKRLPTDHRTNVDIAAQTRNRSMQAAANDIRTSLVQPQPPIFVVVDLSKDETPASVLEFLSQFDNDDVDNVAADPEEPQPLQSDYPFSL